MTLRQGRPEARPRSGWALAYSSGGFECLGGNVWVVVDQVLDGVAALEATEHRVDGDARSVNDRCTPEDIGMRCDELIACFAVSTDHSGDPSSRP